jgi:hypothetical protein
MERGLRRGAPRPSARMSMLPMVPMPALVMVMVMVMV